MTDGLIDDLRQVLISAGLFVNATHSVSRYGIEFTTCPPYHWTYPDCDEATKKILASEVRGRKLDHVFATRHDRSHSYWRFTIVAADFALLNQ